MKLKKTIARISIIFLAAIVLITGCGQQRKPEQELKRPVKIAVLFADMNRDGNKTVKQVMDEGGKQEKVKFYWYDAKNDENTQLDHVKKAVDEKVKVAIIEPVNPLAGAGLTRSLEENNIRVVALENLPGNALVDAYIASDHGMAGKLLARFIINALKQPAGNEATVKEDGQGSAGEAKTVISPGDQVKGRTSLKTVLLTADTVGMDRVIADSAREEIGGNPYIVLVAEEAVSVNNPEQAGEFLQRVLLEQGNDIQAVLATDSRLAVAAVELLRIAGINDTVLTAGVGADEKSVQALTDGSHDAEVDTRPDLMGKYALEAALGLARKGSWDYDSRSEGGSYSVPARIIPVRLIGSKDVYLVKQREGGTGNHGGGQEQDTAGEGSGEGSGSSSNSGGQQGKKTTLRITTSDGKTVEVEINGEITRIESQTGGQQGQADQGGQDGPGGGQSGQDGPGDQGGQGGGGSGGQGGKQ